MVIVLLYVQSVVTLVVEPPVQLRAGAGVMLDAGAVMVEKPVGDGDAGVMADTVRAEARKPRTTDETAIAIILLLALRKFRETGSTIFK